jgi:hypothetical protein
MFLFSLWMIRYGYSQKEWSPIGAKWFINSPVSLGGTTPPDPSLKDYYILECTKDTLVNNVSYRLIGDYLMRQEDGDIFYLYRDTLRLIYSFNVSVGDNLTFNMLDCFGNGADLPYEVEKTDYVYVDGDTLKRVLCKSLTNNSAFPENYEYIEKIGSVRTLVENLAGCTWLPEYEPEWLRCYRDDDIFYKTERFLSYGDYDCNYTEPVSDLKGPHSDRLTIYPNPAGDKIKVVFEDHSGIVTIRKISGETVFSVVMQNRIDICLEGLENGLFILNFISTTGESFHEMIVKY